MTVCDRCGRLAGFSVRSVDMTLLGAHPSNCPERIYEPERHIDLCVGCFEGLKKRVVDFLSDRVKVASK